MEILLQLALLAAGFIMLGKGADLFVEGAAAIARRFGIPPLVVGLTIVAMGTSAPEAAVSITAAFNGSADITIGNVVGSNIMNVWVILGIAAAITPLLVAHSTVRIEIPFMILMTGLLFLLGRDQVVDFTDGIILWVAFLVYLGYLYVMARRGGEEVPQLMEEMSLGKAGLYTVLGMGLIILGSNTTVSAATVLAQFIGLSERIIGLTIVALGTSLPELFTSVTAARKGEADIAIGNIVGSNIFNILFVVGTSALVLPIPFAQAFEKDTYIAIGAAIMLLLCVVWDNSLKRWGGLAMLAAYGAYFWSII